MKVSRGRAVVAVDLGGTKAFVGVVARDGTIAHREALLSRDLRDQPSALLDRLADGVRAAMQAEAADPDHVAAVGLCVPGPLDPTRSVVSVAPNLGWYDVAVREELERRLPGMAVFVENDVRAVALSEHLLGAGRGYDSMLAVFVGSGVGGGLIVRGRLYHGSHGGAGEIGHVVIQAGGPLCGCGRRGDLEAMAARDAVARYVKQAVARGQRTVLTELLPAGLDTLTSRDLAAAIDRNDGVAIRAARRSARYVGLAIGSVVNLLDPGIVVVGGGIAEAFGQRYVDTAALVAREQILSDSARDLPIVAAQLGSDAGLLGAALTAYEGLAAA